MKAIFIQYNSKRLHNQSLQNLKSNNKLPAERRWTDMATAKEALEEIGSKLLRGNLPRERVVFDELAVNDLNPYLHRAYENGGHYGGIPDPRSRVGHRVIGEMTARGGSGPHNT